MSHTLVLVLTYVKITFFCIKIFCVKKKAWAIITFQTHSYTCKTLVLSFCFWWIRMYHNRILLFLWSLCMDQYAWLIIIYSDYWFNKSLHPITCLRIYQIPIRFTYTAANENPSVADRFPCLHIWSSDKQIVIKHLCVTQLIVG